MKKKIIRKKNKSKISSVQTTECGIFECGQKGPTLLICKNGHYLHLSCCAEWSQRSSTCPTCREKAQMEALKPLIDAYLKENTAPPPVAQSHVTRVSNRSSHSLVRSDLLPKEMVSPELTLPFGLPNNPFGTGIKLPLQGLIDADHEFVSEIKELGGGENFKAFGSQVYCKFKFRYKEDENITDLFDANGVKRIISEATIRKGDRVKISFTAKEHFTGRDTYRSRREIMVLFWMTRIDNLSLNQQNE